MKNMILTIAAAILICNLVLFQNDTTRLVWTMNYMKHNCDEMAATAALFIDEGILAEGQVVFDISSAVKMAQKIFEKNVYGRSNPKKRNLFPVEDIKCYITFVDRRNGIVTTDLDGRILGRKPYQGAEQTISLYSKNRIIKVHHGMVAVEMDCGNAMYSLEYLRNGRDLGCYSLYEYVLP